MSRRREQVSTSALLTGLRLASWTGRLRARKRMLEARGEATGGWQAAARVDCCFRAAVPQTVQPVGRRGGDVAAGEAVGAAWRAASGAGGSVGGGDRYYEGREEENKGGEREECTPGLEGVRLPSAVEALCAARDRRPENLHAAWPAATSSLLRAGLNWGSGMPFHLCIAARAPRPGCLSPANPAAANTPDSPRKTLDRALRDNNKTAFVPAHALRLARRCVPASPLVVRLLAAAAFLSCRRPPRSSPPTSPIRPTPRRHSGQRERRKKHGGRSMVQSGSGGSHVSLLGPLRRLPASLPSAGDLRPLSRRPLRELGPKPTP
ncbi:uncharacterized protein BDZ99DRAFT_470430 [Mytilinidion resinicola]|uniref:Uncharacterized protein n=1 Tax=Mytilinidion resinicola TaxID=574789 RepID=A0A6A6Z8G9_9PEZI|nr:uncharacterized protein BDZ99DRAFT_470430 [Mytilinidion resinicola]KAF2817421.1 hypothetical protein BDZ99DRAFT_470430 [Mytilinidion resinicola]